VGFSLSPGVGEFFRCVRFDNLFVPEGVASSGCV